MALNFLLKRSGTASKRPDSGSMALGEVDINYNTSSGGLFYKDSAGSVVKVGPAEVGSSAPNSSPVGSAGNSVGEFWYDTANSVLKIWNGSSWVDTVSTSGFLSTSGGAMTGNLYISNCELQVDATGTFASVGTATFSGTTELNGATSFFFTPTWLENIGPASQVTYDNATSGLAATQVQAAVDELASGSWLPAATTATPGIVQLNDTTSSTSTTEALTANQGKELQDQINAISISSNLVLAGTIDASTGLLVTVTDAGTQHGGFVIGDPLPAADSQNDGYFVIVTVPGTMTPPGGTAQECHQGDWWLSDGTVWQFLDVGFNATYATTSTPGVVQLATDIEVQEGLNTNHAVTPSGLQSKLSDSTSTTSSTTIASSTAVKAAYDHASLAITDAATAQGTADFAQADASQALLDAAAAQSTADQAVLDAAAAQGDATQALSDAAAAQSTADQAVLDASAAQADADQALLDAAAAQGTADAAIPENILTTTGDILFASAASTAARLGIGTTGQVLTVSAGGLPVWATAGGGGGLTGITNSVTTALGGGALDSITDPAVLNTAVGIDAGTAITTGDQNTLVGYQAGLVVTNGAANVLMGHQAGVALTGTGNVGIGSAAGPTGAASDSVFVGPNAGNLASGNSNVGIGSGAIAKATGNFNTGVGTNAGAEISSGASNTFVGNGAGRTITTGSNNTIIGRYTGGGDPALSNNVIISAGASDIKLVINNTDAVSFGGLSNFGTSGQVLTSQGSGAAPTWTTVSTGGVAGVTGTAPITVNNTDPANPVIGVSAASTSAAGVVQLNDSVSSTSATQAATANAAKTAYDTGAAAQVTANAAIPCASLTAKGNLIVATAASTPTALPVGTDGQVLTANSACASGVAWAAAASGGVTQIIAGTNVTISPVGGTGAVTINASGGGGGGTEATPSALGTVFGWAGIACLSTAYGQFALKNRNTVCNLAVGYQAMCNTTVTSCNNTAVGQDSSPNLNGCNNVLVGNDTGGGASGVAAMAGSGNTAVGACAMGCAFNVNSSVAIGNNAGLLMCGDNNVGVGTNALRGNAAFGATGAQNTGVGHNALCRYTAGACNTSLGWQSLFSLTTGSCNTALGHGALGNVTTGLNNLAIGIFSGTTTGAVSGLVNLTTECNNIVLGNFNHTCAQIKVAWTVTSDERDKAIDPTGVPYGLEFVNQIEPIAYCWCDRATGEVTEDRKRFGFSAQNISALETSTAEPIIVSADDPENLRFTDQMLLPVLVNAIKELSAKNDELEARIRLLEIPG